MRNSKRTCGESKALTFPFCTRAAYGQAGLRSKVNFHQPELSPRSGAAGESVPPVQITEPQNGHLALIETKPQRTPSLQVSVELAGYFTPALAAASGSIFFKAVGTATIISFELRSANNFTSTGTAALALGPNSPRASTTSGRPRPSRSSKQPIRAGMA